MAEVTCVDGSRLGVHPVPVVDRDGVPYELTLRLTRDSADFATVGERCGYFLAATAARLTRARAGDAAWPDIDDRFPASSVEGGIRAWASDEHLDPATTWAGLQRYLPRERDLFVFRHRDPDDAGGVGELRCAVRTQKAWVGGTGTAGGGGRWRLARRAVLTSGALAEFVAQFLAEAAVLGCAYDIADTGDLMRRPAG